MEAYELYLDRHDLVKGKWQYRVEGLCAPSAPTDEARRRKGIPLYSGGLSYFPLAFEALAELSRIGNDQHNPGSPLHWDRSKSGDELDALMRHLTDRAKGEVFDTDKVRHLTKVFWRAGAALQKEIEAEREQDGQQIAADSIDPRDGSYQADLQRASQQADS
jgi:hypothetical protein